MADLFISYSREDTDFVRRLYDALKERGREAWVDWEGIPPIDKWLDRIRSSIDEADAFLFVISPDSVKSKVCEIEFDQALQQHKRLIPVMYREVESQPIRPELSEINWIFARDGDSFNDACETIITALDTDLEWTRVHTRLLVRATEWDRENRETSFTLRGRDLNDFEEWLARSPDKDPKPIALQSEYLLASRRAVTRRQRIIWGSVAVGLSLAVGLGTIAHFQSRERERQEMIAEARELVNKAEVFREGPVDEIGTRGRLMKSTLLASRALATLDELGVPSLEVAQAVRKSYAKLPKWIDFGLEHERIDASAFDPTGNYLVVFLGRERFMIWDTIHRREVKSCDQPLSAMESVLGIEVWHKANFIVTAVYNASRKVDATEITIWSLSNCKRKFRVQEPGRRNLVALGDNGEILVIADKDRKI